MRTFNTTLLSFIALLFLSSSLFAQDHGAEQQKRRSADYCLTDKVDRRLRENASPKKAQRIQEAEQKLIEHRKNYDKSQRAGQVYVIPVVFHVIHDYGPENLPRENLENVIDILNRDYRKNNGDTSDIVPEFDSLAADIEIEFRIAQKDPNGDCHRGVTRTQSEKTYDGDYQMKTLIQWDPSMYLNVWVCNKIGGSAAAYAVKPASADQYPSQDGIVISHDFVGSLPPSSTSRSRTLTHEVGHYLNLDHPWGGSNAGQPGDGGNCSYDDGIGDTPNTIGWTYCDKNGSSCSSLDNVQNYMSYSYCHRMFTVEQRTEMRSTITSSVADRNNLWTSSNLQATGVSGGDILCEADFEASQKVACVGQNIQFKDLSYHNPDSWTWQFPGGNSTGTSTANPSVSYPDTGTYDVTLTASNSNGSATKTLQDHIKIVQDTGSPLPWVDKLDYIDNFPNYPHYFIENKPKDNVTWEHTEQAGEGGSNGCLMLDNHSNSGGEIDAFTTRTMDATQIPNGNLELTFDAAYRKISSSDQGELTVYVSDDCGATWDQRGSYSATELATASPDANPYYPSNNEWEHYTINSSLIGIYNVSNLRFKFEFISTDGGNNLFIDNINVHDQENVGIEEKDEQKAHVKILPNPAQEKAFLQLGLSKKERVSIQILDLRGKTVKEVQKGQLLDQGKHRVDLDLQDLGSGPYFVKVKTGDQLTTKKLFVE